jgi:hypothetical protein
LLLFNLMSERSIMSSRSRVTLSIFLEVFLHRVEMLSDWTFWDEKEIKGKRGGRASGRSLLTLLFSMI